MAQPIPCTLQTFRKHSIFLPAEVTTKAEEEEWELVEAPSTASIGQKVGKMVMRDKDLILAIESEIRMTSLSGGEAWGIRNGIVGGYKTLKSPHLTFPIEQMVLNTTGRLLAVVGRSQVSVLVLPKTGFIGTSIGEINCRSFAIDEFQLSASASAAITKVLWHPLGEGGNSLWVLTADGKLREYDIVQPQDPAQTFSFLSSTSSASSSRFTAIDPLSRYATSFAFSPSQHDYTAAFMIHVLMANGDIYVMGPVTPLHTEMSLRDLQGLKAYADGKLKRDGESGRIGMLTQWVDGLVRQVKADDDTRRRREEESTLSRRNSTLYGHRRSGSAVSAISMEKAPPPEGVVRIHPPHLTERGGPAPGIHRSIMRQGPVLLDPAPLDVSNGEEDEDQVASDLYIFASVLNEGEQGVTVVAIAWSGGRVDLGIQVNKPEPRWISSRDQDSSTPSLAIVESILMPLSSSDQSILSTNAPIFIPDPVDPDTIFVQHSFGVDSIRIRTWVAALQAEDELPGSEVSRLVECAGSKAEPIIGVATFCNITLGYGVLALASSHRLAAIELDFRSSGDEPKAPTPIDMENKSVTTAQTQDNQSLLQTHALDFDKTITSITNPSPSYNPRKVIQKLPEYTKPIQTITPEHLRVLGEITNQLHTRTQAIRAASQIIENRLDLQVQELQRQIKLLQDCQNHVGNLKARKSPAKAEKLVREQEGLSVRLDKVLVAMSGEYRPKIGEVERKWFDELERIRVRARGGGVTRTKGLSGRVQLLSEQLKSVKPAVEAQNRALLEESSSQSPGGGRDRYGSKQLEPIKAALIVRSEEIRKMIKKLDGLTLRVDEAVEVESEDGEGEGEGDGEGA